MAKPELTTRAFGDFSSKIKQLSVEEIAVIVTVSFITR